MRMLRSTAWIVALTGALASPAAAEHLVTSLSSHRVLITSNFVGEEIVLFGSIERDAQSPARRGGYDVIVTVTGPRQTMVVRRKDRVFGVWVNAESRTFVNVPSYLAVLATRPIDAITDAATLQRNQIGLERTLLRQVFGPDIADVGRDDPMRMAFLRLKMEQNLYSERGNAVTFLTPTLIRAVIPIPANVLVGNYDVDVKVFADGAPITRDTSAMEVIKVGVEQLVAAAAHEHAILYGLTTMMMALMTGWLASVVFRKD